MRRAVSSSRTQRERGPWTGWRCRTTAPSGKFWMLERRVQVLPKSFYHRPDQSTTKLGRRGQPNPSGPRTPTLHPRPGLAPSRRAGRAEMRRCEPKQKEVDRPTPPHHRGYPAPGGPAALAFRTAHLPGTYPAPTLHPRPLALAWSPPADEAGNREKIRRRRKKKSPPLRVPQPTRRHRGPATLDRPREPPRPRAPPVSYPAPRAQARARPRRFPCQRANPAKPPRRPPHQAPTPHLPCTYPAPTLCLPLAPAPRPSTFPALAGSRGGRARMPLSTGNLPCTYPAPGGWQRGRARRPAATKSEGHRSFLPCTASTAEKKRKRKRKGNKKKRRPPQGPPPGAGLSLGNLGEGGFTLSRS